VEVHAVALQADGKIVVAGTNGGFLLLRYNADGSLDTSFDGDGIATTTAGGAQVAYGVAVQADGKIVAAGSGFTLNGTTAFQPFAVARLNADGSPDAAFDGDGVATTDFGPDFDAAHAVAVQADGKIVAAGLSANSGGSLE